eukprot:1042034-Pleurochrysis_carterae.AAC.1
MAHCPIGIRVTTQSSGENAVSRGEERWGRAAHGSAEHSDGVCNIRSGLRGAVQERSHKGL